MFTADTTREAATGFTTGVVSPSWRAPERSRSLMVVTVTMWFGWSMFTDSDRDVTKCSSSSASSGETRNPALQSAQLFTRYAHLFLQCHAEGGDPAFACRVKGQRGLNTGTTSTKGKLLLPAEGTWQHLGDVLPLVPFCTTHLTPCPTRARGLRGSPLRLLPSFPGVHERSEELTSGESV